MNFLFQPWPWYVTGPLIGLMVPLLLWLGNKPFGISHALRDFCAMCIPANIDFFKYDWRAESWNLFLVAGVMLGGVLAGMVFANPLPIALSDATVTDLSRMGIDQNTGLMPAEIFGVEQFGQFRNWIFVMGGGFLVGFGTRWAGGCTSGHAIAGLASLQWPSLVATITFFAFGILSAWVLVPFLLSL